MEINTGGILFGEYLKEIVKSQVVRDEVPR